MNKFLKLFPVALAVAALSSCSNDDLLGEKSPEYKLGDNDILVTMDESVSTRAAFGESQFLRDGRTGFLRSFFFTEGDSIKLYDDLNWRPQTFVYNEVATKKLHRFVPGEEIEGSLEAVFTSSEYNPKETSENTYKGGYGVFPGGLSTFDGELRSKINFDLTSLAFIDGDALESVEIEDFNSSYNIKQIKKVRKTATPMWGNLGKDDSGEDVPGALTLKFLTGFIRVGMDSTTTDKGKQAWLVVQSTSMPLNGKYTATDFDYTAKAAPVLNADNATKTGVVKTEKSYVYANAVANTKHAGGKTQKGEDKIKTDVGTANGTGVIVMKLPTLEEGANDAIYIPIPKGEYPLSIKLVTAAANAQVDVLDLTDNATVKTLLNEDNFDKITDNGVFYYLDLYTTSNIHTPYELAERIKFYDEDGRTNISFTVKSAVTVKGNTTPQDQNLYIGNLDHNVTVNLEAGIVKSTEANAHFDHAASLYITKSGAGKLILNLGGNLANYPTIVVRETGTDSGNYKTIKSSNVKGDTGGIIINNLSNASGTLSKLVVETSDNVVTLNCPASVVNLKGKMIIDALDKVITNLNAKPYETADGEEGESVVTLNNGKITNVVTNKNKLTINSKGKSFITKVRMVSAATASNVDTWEDVTPTEWSANTTAVEGNDYAQVELNSEWDGVYYTATDMTQQAEIHTAAQFSIGGFLANTHLHTNLLIGKTFEGDATDAQKNWKGLTLDQNFDGAGKTVELVTNYNGSNNIGLFNEIKNVADAAQIIVKHLTLKADVQPAEGTYRAQIGGLAGNVDGATKGIKFSRIVLDENSQIGYFTPQPNYTNTAGSKIGGLIGNAIGVVNIENSQVAGNVAGFAALGGYIGQVSGADTEITFGTTDANGSELATANADNKAFGGVLYSPATSVVEFTETRTMREGVYNVDYGTIGMFVGKVADNKAIVKVSHNSALVANNKIEGSEADLLFNRNHIKVGKDEYGNDKYYNYRGSYRNVVGYSSAATAVDQLQAGYVDALGHHYATLQQRLANQEDITTYYFNWFAPEEDAAE